SAALVVSFMVSFLSVVGADAPPSGRPGRPAVWRRCCRSGGGEGLTAVGPEAGPVAGGVGVDDGGLEVAEVVADVVECSGVGGEVDDLVVETSVVECPHGRGALHALGLGVDGDAHGSVLSMKRCLVGLPPTGA